MSSKSLLSCNKTYERRKMEVKESSIDYSKLLKTFAGLDKGDRERAMALIRCPLQEPRGMQFLDDLKEDEQRASETHPPLPEDQ